MKFRSTLFIILLTCWGYAQSPDPNNQYSEIPGKFLNHPELGKTNHNVRLHEAKYELVHNRTKFSRTFLNTNTTRTTIQSSVPMHYQDQDGFWRSIDYSVTQSGGKWIFPRQNPAFEISESATAIATGNGQVTLGGQSAFLAYKNGSVISKEIVTSSGKATVENQNQVMFRNASGVDKKLTLFHGALKYDYIINNAALIPADLDYLIVEETILLPDGFSARHNSGQISIFDRDGNQSLTFNQPVISDSNVIDPKFRHDHRPYEAETQLEKISDSKYIIRIKIDGAWLTSPERTFPLIIDPVITINNGDIVNSCFFPVYQQASLQVAVPEGQTILSSTIGYDFISVDGSGSWMADQRSYVSGPSGQTPVQNGQGSSSGLLTYTIPNSEIANGVSTGNVQFVFHISRNWGGSGCNATYNFVNRREVAVTYGTIEFGDGPVVINEYSASNRNFNDEFGRNEDWIELYNTSPDSYFNLAGYYLSNDSSNPTKWQFDNGVIPPNSRVLIFCSDRDFSSGTVFHTSFDLTQTKGDEVVFADPSGNIIESREMFITQTNHSYGRTSDGASTWGIFTSPTPGASNVNSYANYTSKPEFSLAAGRYSGSVTVALASSGSNEQIRYTTNGATPTATSTLYTGPININQTTVIRARAFSTQAGILPGFIETNTYFINENSTLPIFSFAGDADLMQLFSGTQNKPLAHFEFFEEDGSFIDENIGDFDKHGNDSWAYSQRGVDFVSRDDHGYKRRLEHKFFSTTDRTEFRRLMVKPAGSDNYPHQQGGAHMRDAFVQTLSQLSELDLDERSARFVNLFVNGQYWGVYDLRERVDDNHYTDYYYGQDYTYRESDIYLQYLKTWGSTENRFGNQAAANDWQNLLQYIQNNDMAADEHFNYVDSQLNVNSLIDYFVINSYMVNRDWLNYNTSWWRGLDPDGEARKWRYALWDMDGVLGHYVNFTGVPNTSATAPPCQVEDLTVGVGHTATIKKLIDENPTVRQRYVTRYADLLNTKLSCERVTQVFDSIVAVISPEMPRQIQRWGGNMTTWQANVTAARNFLLERCSQTINAGMTDCYDVVGPFETIFQVEPANSGKIRMNSEWLANFPTTAQLFGNIETLLKAQGNPGYEFSHWVVDGAIIEPDPENPEITLDITQATSVTAHFTYDINAENVIYYWHFNNLNTPNDVTSIAADYKLIPSASPLMTYTGTGPRDIDAADSGSAINLHLEQAPGKCARVRNPSDNRSLIFDMPTPGYKDIRFAYAIERTNQGQLTNQISYSTDGTNFTEAGLIESVFNVSPDYKLVEVDFTSLPEVNNNENFKIRITFSGNTTADNGNNRYDNITLKGVADVLSVPTHGAASIHVFPNPFKDNVQVFSSETLSELTIYDLLGKKIWHKKDIGANTQTIDLSALNAGVYLLKIKSSEGTSTHKLVKQ